MKEKMTLQERAYLLCHPRSLHDFSPRRFDSTCIGCDAALDALQTVAAEDRAERDMEWRMAFDYVGKSLTPAEHAHRWATEVVEQRDQDLKKASAESTRMISEMADAIEELESVLRVGWYYADTEYTDESWVGPFDTREGAFEHAKDGEYSEEHLSFREIGDISKVRTELDKAKERDDFLMNERSGFYHKQKAVGKERDEARYRVKELRAELVDLATAEEQVVKWHDIAKSLLGILQGSELKGAETMAAIHGFIVSAEVSKRNGDAIREAGKELRRYQRGLKEGDSSGE